MSDEWVEKINSIHGVDCSLIVDRDGLIISKAGSTSDQIAPHSALMVMQLMEKIGVQTMDEWRWTQCETEDLIIAVSYVYVGILVIVMRTDANLSKVRLETENLRGRMNRLFKGPFVIKHR